jgi:hypothetical protein
MDEEKSKTCRFSSTKWLWVRVNFSQFAVAGKAQQYSCSPAEKSVINI